MSGEEVQISAAGESRTHDRITEAYLGERGKVFMHRTRRRIHWICDRVRGPRVLDIGCSQGITCILLARAGHEVTGIDLDAQVMAEARAYLAAEPQEVRDRVRLVHGDAAEFPQDATYDTVILGEILEHLEDPGWLIDIAADRTVPGGRLVVTVPFGVNDFPDHKQTFYLTGPRDLIARRFNVAHVEMLGKWIGFLADKPAAAGDLVGPTSDAVSLPMLEAGFEQLERILIEEKDGVKERLVRATDNLDRAQVQASQLKRQLRVAEEERDSYKTQTDQLKRQLRVAAEERAAEAAALRAEIETAGQELATQAVGLEAARRAEAAQGRNRARADALTIRSLQERLDQIAESTSFRLGHALVLGVKSPRRILGLPGTAWRLWREERVASESSAPSASAPSASAAWAAAVRRDFEKGGTQAAIAAVLARAGDDAAARAAALIRAGGALAREGFPAAEQPMIAEAARIARTEPNLRALFWAAQRAGDFATANACTREITEIYGPAPTSAQRAMLDKLKRGQAFQYAILEDIPPRGPRLYEPAPDRLCYVLHNSLPYTSGGYATRAQGMALGLKAAGLDVQCLTRPGYPLDIKAGHAAASTPSHDRVEGVDYLRVFTPQRTDMSARAYMLAAAEEITGELKRLRPQWVMGASNFLTAMPALIAARRVGVPFFYEVRGFWEVTRLSREPEYAGNPNYVMYRLLEGETAKQADHVFTLTGPMRTELVARGVPEARITLLPNACDPERFRPRPRDAALADRIAIPDGVPVIGYVGTFTQYEGLDDLARACARLRARGRDFRLLLVGNENASGREKGPITAEIERVAAENGLSDWLILPGRVPHEEVEAYYSLIDIAPFPRKPQPVTEMVSPMKPLEALAMEKAVVVSSVRALTEMIADGRTGLVFKKGDVESLADTLDRLIGDVDLRARLAREGRDWVTRERTWTQMGAQAAKRLDHIRAAGPAWTSNEGTAADAV